MKVFLSRDSPSEELINHAQKSGWELTCFSCIQKTIITSEGPPEADWIFFYSPGAVRLWAKNFTRSTQRLAVLGEGTAQAMRECGMKPEFVGSSANPSEAVVEFGQFLTAKERVVQARGEKSFERLREVLNSAQILDWPHYRTSPKTEFPEATADYYIFTSPSNVEAYLAKYSMPADAVALAFGESTRVAIREKASVRILVTVEPGEEGAIHRIEIELEK